MTTGVYGRRDLLMALLDARKQAGRHVDLSSYAEQRWRGMSTAFGVHIDTALTWEQEPESGNLGDYIQFLGTLAAYESLRSPWDSFLETPPAVVAKIRRYGTPMAEAQRTYGQLLLDLMEELLGELWSVANDRVVTADDLRRAGFDPVTPRPEPADYI
jgi:hypothetical protein